MTISRDAIYVHSFGGSGAFVCGFVAFEALGAIVDSRWRILGRKALRSQECSASRKNNIKGTVQY